MRASLAATVAIACLGLAGAGRASAPPEPPTVATPEARPEAAGGAPPSVTASALAPVLWRELRYSARKFIFTASTSLTAERVPAGTVERLLPRPPKATAIPIPSGDAVAVTTATRLPFGRDETVTLWLDPATGAALGGEKTMLGGNPYHKLLRFTEGGLYTSRAAPASGREDHLGPDRWSDRRQYLTRPAVQPPEAAAVTDAYALLYLVSAARLDRKDSSLRLVMLTDEGYVELAFVTGGLSRVRVSFDESWPGGSRQVAETLVRSVRATGHALGTEQPRADVDLGFLGMRGALTLFVEVGSGIPVVFSGRAEHVGNLTVRLDRAVLTAAPADPATNPAPGSGEEAP